MAYGFRNIPVGVAIMFAVASCLPDPLEVHDIPQLEQKIVVSSQLIPGQAVAVLLTKSIGALDAGDDSNPEVLLNQTLISDAVVTLDGNGSSYPLRYLGRGVYATAFSPLQVGQQYTLNVSSPTMGTVKATTTVKPTVQFTAVDAFLAITGRDSLAQVTYTIVDQQPDTNWYMIAAQHVTRENFEERIINPRVTTKLLSEADFTQNFKKDSFRILFDEVEDGDTISVSLSNIHKDYYDFMKLREDTRFGLAAALGEPINYPTNVEGGLGFFNLFVPDVRLIVLGE